MGKVTANNRILYVEPSFSNGSIDGQAMTPDYSDFSLWCNLIVERTSRFSNQKEGYNSDNETDYLTVDMTYQTKAELDSMGDGDLRRNNYVSFMRGKDVNKYNYLSTDYSEINFNEIKQRNIVEGLQISSIQVSNANMVCPEVTIKFVDIRGAGLFAREEAIHGANGKISGFETDSYGNTFENVFGGFFSIPYPRFKLQIKGFYGKPVTYQLVCKGFSGNFNSNNGNFEITAKFIGMAYGVLQDIPMQYIVSAPDTKIGREYWNNHVYSEEWRLANGEVPVRLTKFFDNVEGSMQDLSARGVDIEESIIDAAEYADYMLSDVQIDNLVAIRTSLDKLVVEIKKTPQYKDYCVVSMDNAKEGDNITTNAIILFSDRADNNPVEHAVVKAINEVNVNITKYNSGLNDTSKSIDYIMGRQYVSDGIMSCKFSKIISTSPIEDTDTFDISTDCNDKNGNAVNIPIRSSAFIDCVCNSFVVDTDKVLIDSYLSNVIFKAIPTTNSNKYQYISILDLGNIQSVINDSIRKYEEYNDSKSDSNNDVYSIRELLGFSPFIGNFFKVVMCHLETFAYLMKSCADTIEAEMLHDSRRFDLMGVSSLEDETDVPKKQVQIPPFPALYKKYTTSSDGEGDNIAPSRNDVKSQVWIGDFKGSIRWVEEEFVSQLYDAMMRVDNTNDAVYGVYFEDVNGIAPIKDIADKAAPPVIRVYDKRYMWYGNDFINSKMPEYAYTDKASVAFYAAQQAYKLLSMNNGYAKLKPDEIRKIAVGDAQNLVRCAPDNFVVNNLVGGGEAKTLAEELYNIALCKNSGNGNKYCFEKFRISEGRHPVLKETVDGKLLYIYAYTNGNISEQTIPIISERYGKFFRNFSDIVTLRTTNDFRPKNMDGGDYIYVTNSAYPTEDFLALCEYDATKYDSYRNRMMFDIVLDDVEFLCDKLLVCGYYDNYEEGDLLALIDTKASEYDDILSSYYLDSDGFSRLFNETINEDDIIEALNKI